MRQNLGKLLAAVLLTTSFLFLVGAACADMSDLSYSHTREKKQTDPKDYGEFNMNIVIGANWIGGDWAGTESRVPFQDGDIQTNNGQARITVDYLPRGWWVAPTVGYYNSDGKKKEGTIVMPDLSYIPDKAWDLTSYWSYEQRPDGKYNVSGQLRSMIYAIDIGAKKYFGDEDLRFYLAGGVTYAAANLYIQLPNCKIYDSDGGWGPWANAGLTYTFFKWLNIGADARYSRVELELYDKKRALGGLDLGLLVGFRY